MRHSKRILSVVLVFALCLALAISVSAATMTLRGSIRLNANYSSVITQPYAGFYGQGKVSNNSGSAQDVYFELQSSSGTSWKICTTLFAAPGKTTTSNVWAGAADQLWRIKVAPETVPNGGYPGCIATGYIYTGTK